MRDNQLLIGVLLMGLAVATAIAWFVGYVLKGIHIF